MNKTLRKTISVILSVLLLMMTVPFAFAADTVTLYCRASASWGTTIYIYGWVEDTAARPLGDWPGTAMTAVEGEDKLYSCEVPSDLKGLIFNDGSSQTADLSLPTDGNNCYEIENGQWTAYSAEECQHIDNTDVNYNICDLCGAYLGEDFLPGTDILVSADLANDTYTFHRFIPEETGTYTIFSDAETDPRINIYDADMQHLVQEDDNYGRNFSFLYDFTAGETYYFVFSDYHGCTQYKVSLIAPHEHTGTEQTCMGYKCEICSAYFGEAGDTHTDNTDDNYNICDLCGAYLGEDFVPGTDILVSADWTNDIYTFHRFIPEETGTYIIFSDGEDNPYFVLYDAERNFMAESDDVNGNNFHLSYDFTEGETYYFVFSDYNGCTQYKVSLIAPHEHTGTEQTCIGYKCEICGAYFGEAGDTHTDNTDDKYNICDYCGAYLGEDFVPGTDILVSADFAIGTYTYHRFIPEETGTYIIFSDAETDPCISIYGADMQMLAEADDDDGFNFSLSYSFNAGEIYYFVFSDYNGCTQYKVSVIAPHEHTGTEQTCIGYKCEICGEYFGEAGEHTPEGEQTCLGTYCSVCGNYFGETGEHTPEGEQTCLGTYCSVCGAYFGEAGEHTPEGEQTCLGTYCSFCEGYYGEADPDAHSWNGTECDICGEVHEHTGGTETCMGYKCEICNQWYGEEGDQHDLSSVQTCMGYRCNLCYKYFGEKGNHATVAEQTCMGYICKYCYNWYGEADANNHTWEYGYCIYCETEYPADKECTHVLDDSGRCTICTYQCPHETIENGVCTNCSYTLAFSLTTGDTVTYHSTFTDAFNNAVEGSEIDLLSYYFDYTSVDMDKAITIDFNGHYWEQPSSGYHTISADVTFIDSVGGGGTYYGIRVNSPCTFKGGSYRYIDIMSETVDITLEELLGTCCSYYDYSDEIIDLSGETYSGEDVTVKSAHNPSGWWASNETEHWRHCVNDCCSEEITGTRAAHSWENGKCTVCRHECEHSFTQYTETKAPTCTEAGEKTSPCAYCDSVDLTEIPALNHEDTLVQVEAKAPTCSEIGWEAYEYCTACDYTTYKEIPTTSHKDDDGDYLCDYGCGYEFEKPAEPDTPDEPDEPDTPDEPDNECDHLCHKDGILGFFWKIICFFYRLFDIQQYCDCGQLHYDAPLFG